MSKTETYAEQSDKGKSSLANRTAMQDLQIMKWQRLSYMSVVISLICILGVLYVSTRSTFIPYVIHVDPQTGYVKSLGALEQTKSKLTPAEINYFLSQFVTGIRSIPKDEYVLKENIDRATRLLTPQSASKYRQVYLSEFTSRLGVEISRVKILNINPIPQTKNTYQVRWEEFASSRATGGNPTRTIYTGNFNIEQKKITDKEDLVENPLGLYIADFEFSKEGAGRQ